MKLIFDKVLSLVGLLIFIPILLVVALKIKSEDGGPVFYRGERVGLHKKKFYMLKFRTMVMNAEKIGGPTTSLNDPRITRIGHFIRKFKIDELPQLINVIKGDMSLVGPRPEVVSEVRVYDSKWDVIFSIRPGITDLSSIEFSNEGEIIAKSGIADSHEAYRLLIQPKKLKLQKHYAMNQSFLLDLKILWQTFLAVIKKNRILKIKRSRK
ncbi:MAG: sugar transferase [Desulfobacterales bacterium]|nr:sugar transferase [Desulfobacterales bacterium]